MAPTRSCLRSHPTAVVLQQPHHVPDPAGVERGGVELGSQLHEMELSLAWISWSRLILDEVPQLIGGRLTEPGLWGAIAKATALAFQQPT